MIEKFLARLWSSIAGALVPILLGLLAAASIGLVVQTIRIEGLRIWPIKIAGLRAERDQWRSAEHDWRRAAEIMRGSFDTLHQALGVQKAAVAWIKAESATRQAAGKAALGQAVQRGGALEAMARQIEAAPPVAGACRTPGAVMTAKGEL